MAFKLSKRSLGKLEGVKPELVEVVKRAIELTKIDFGVIEGLRTEKRQKELFDKGASKTMNSKHLGGNAVEVICLRSCEATPPQSCFFFESSSSAAAGGPARASRC